MSQFPENRWRLLLAIAALTGQVAQAQQSSVSLPGKEISRVEAVELAEKVAVRIYDPSKFVSSYRCEFEPHFIDITDYFLSQSEGGNPRHYVPEGVRVGMFDFGPAVHPFRDDGLSKATTAEFYWKKFPRAQPMVAFPVAVVLNDDQGHRLDVHPGATEFLALALLTDPPGIVDLMERQSDDRFEISYRLDTGNPEEHDLLKVFKYEVDSATEGAESIGYLIWRLTFAPDGAPLTFLNERWIAGGEKQPDGMYYRFERLGDTTYSAVVQRGLDNDARKYGWREVDGVWLIDRLSGMRPTLSPVPPHTAPWELELRNFEVNPELDDALFQIPEVPPPALDLSTPEKAIESILTCLRDHRIDLLSHCHVEKMGRPINTRIPRGNNYYFEAYPELRDRLVVESRWQDGNDWVYRVLIPQPLRTRRLGRDIRLVHIDGEWRMDADIGLLQLAFYD